MTQRSLHRAEKGDSQYALKIIQYYLQIHLAIKKKKKK